MSKDVKVIYEDSNFQFDRDYDSELFLKVRIKVMHDLDNPNKSFFKKSAMEDAKYSIFNKPILGRIIENKDGEEDFNGHDVEMKIVDSDDGLKLEYEYIEKIIGIIPETNNYTVEYDEESGRNYAYVDGYIFKGYSNGADDIFLRDGEKKVSMEILVDEGSFNKETELYDIEKFRYTGITVLGNHLETGMIGAKAIVRYEKTNEVYEKMLFELNKELNDKKEKGVEELPMNNFIFELSHDDLRGLIWDKVNPMDEEGRREWKYWVMEVFDTYFVVQSEEESNKYYRVTYEKTEDDVTIGDFVEIFVEYLSEEEMNAVKEMRNQIETLGQKEKEFEEKELEFKTKEEEFLSKEKEFEIEKATMISANEELNSKYETVIESLKSYQEKEKVEKVDSLIDEFESTGAFDEDEIETFRNKSLEITVEELEKELVFALGIKNREKKFTAIPKQDPTDEAVKKVPSDNGNREKEEKEFAYDEKYKHLFENN